MNKKKVSGREIEVSLAKTKEEYAPIKEEEAKQREAKKQARLEEKQNKQEEFNKTKAEKSLNFDEQNTLFLRNVAFTVEESTLKAFFEKFGEVKYTKIVKNKETGSSRGTAFVLMAEEEGTKKVLESYEKYKENTEMNPFEIEGRKIHILKAVSREDVDGLESKERNDKRNKLHLYYGLKPKETKQYNEADKAKREEFFRAKKQDFKKNPNLHVSQTSSILNRNNSAKPVKIHQGRGNKAISQ